MRVLGILQALGVQLICRFASVYPHGYLSEPAAQYTDLSTMTNYITTVDASKIYGSKKWNGSPEENSVQYKQLLHEGAINELKPFIDSYVNGCPKNVLNQVIDVESLTSMHWQNDQYKEGFISSHTGPCEAWIDDTKVFTNDNCAYTYKEYPAVLPINYKKCKSSTCEFKFYWMAIHEPNWQLYKACVMISGSAVTNSTNAESQNVNGTFTRNGNTQQFNCTLNQ